MKCTICGRAINKLYGGMCAGCLGDNGCKDEKRSEDDENSIEGLNTGEKLKNGELVNIFSSMYNNGIKVMHARTHEEGKDETCEHGGAYNSDDELYRLVTKQLRLDEKGSVIYYTAIHKIMEKFDDRIESGEYKVLRMEDYGVVDAGTFIENIGGLAVYKSGTDYSTEDDLEDLFNTEEVDTGYYTDENDLSDELAEQ